MKKLKVKMVAAAVMTLIGIGLCHLIFDKLSLMKVIVYLISFVVAVLLVKVEFESESNEQD